MAENPRPDLRELNRVISTSLPESDNHQSPLVGPVERYPRSADSMTVVDFHQQYLAAGVIPENRLQVWLAGRVPYLRQESLFVLDERGLPQPQTVKQLGTLPCGCAIDGRTNRFAGICPFDQLEVCSAHWVPSCGICLLAGCLFCTREYKGDRVHRWHLGPAHPIRGISNVIWKLRSSK